MKSKRTKILDIKVNSKLINQTEIARETGLSQAYVSMLLKGTRKSEKNMRKIRNAIIRIYGSFIQY